MRTGRPHKKIDKKIFENLCAMQCTIEEMCCAFDVAADTLEDWCKREYKDEDGNGLTFSKVFAVKRGAGKISLRRKQWKLADTNASMAIFLGKQYLGQSDNPELQYAEQGNDNFLEALSGTALEDWIDEETADD